MPCGEYEFFFVVVIKWIVLDLKSDWTSNVRSQRNYATKYVFNNFF